MSEPKRIALIPLAAAEAAQAPLPAKKDKKSPTKIVKTHRFTLTLPDSTEKSCPEFNFADLISALTKKKEGHATNGSAPSVGTGPLDPFADDDEDQLRGIAKKFEEKYGLPAAKKKKSRKYDDYVDLGAGYDETDPFIDNTDAYDEIVPAEVTTAHGGFYINSGALEFKPVEKRSDTESESESESSESDSDDSLSEASTTPISSSKKRRVIESDEDDSPEEIALNGSEGEETDASKRKPRLDETSNVQLAKRKKISSPSESGETGLVCSKKPRTSVKELLQQKREQEKATPVSEKQGANKNHNNNESTPPASVVATPPTSTVKELLQMKRDREKDVVDLSMPNKATIEANTATTESSSDSSDSSSESSESDSGGDEDEEGRDTDVVKGENDADTKLPNNLTTATLNFIEDIKKAAASSDQQGKCRFFSPEINRLLLAIELQARQYSCSKRQAIFTHLAGFLPCTKHTLLKRAKNLVLENVESQLKPATRKLQLAIEKVIGEQIERYTTQCQRLAEANPERYLEYYRYVWDPELEPAGGTDDEERKNEKTSKQPQPRRRFQWNKEIRSILNQVVFIKAECFNWSKLRKETAAEYILRFLDSEIRLLWPKGWMTAKILFKESQEAHSFVTSKSKLIANAKKTIPVRTGLVDALAPPASVNPSTISLPNTPTPVGSTPSVSKEMKKSQLKDRMLSVTPQPTARLDSNISHHRSDSAPNLSSAKTEKFRAEGGIPISRPDRPDNGSIKLESNKHRHRPDSSFSSARTEVHLIAKDNAKASSRQSEIFNAPNQNRTVDSNHSSSLRSDHTNDAPKARSEPTNSSKGNTVQVRSDLAIIKSEISYSQRLKDAVKPRHDPDTNQRGSSEVSKASRSETNSSSELKIRFDQVQNVPKAESTLNKTDVIQSDVSSVNSTKSNKNNKAIPTLGPSIANSLASFVDSGLRWSENPDALDLSDEQQPSRLTSKTTDSAARNVETPVVKESISKVEETEDQESLLQRDLAMVLEEISQITRLVEGKDQSQQLPSQNLPPLTAKSGDSRTKSVIKSTGSLSSSHVPSSAPVLSSNPTCRPIISSGSSLPPKLTAASRTPPPPQPQVQPAFSSVSRISSSPTGSNSSNSLISPTQTHSSRTISPVSSDLIKSGQGKYNANINKIPINDFMTPPTAHSSSRHAGSFYASDHMSPEKRKPDTGSPQQSQPPLPAHQQHASTNAVPRSSPNTIFRNFPASSTQAVTTPSIRSSHSIESLMQTKKSPDLNPTHRTAGVTHPGQQVAQSSLPKHDPLSVFMNQKNSQKNSHGDFSYYP